MVGPPCSTSALIDPTLGYPALGPASGPGLGKLRLQVSQQWQPRCKMAARQIITTGILDYAELYWESLAFIGTGLGS
jgi:hypothetical protein